MPSAERPIAREGYRKPEDIMFRDSTQQTVTRVSGSKIRSLSARACSSSTLAPTLTRSLRLEKDQGLVDFFTNNFIDGDYAGLRNNLFWIPRDFENMLKTDYVKSSIQGCGAMALARLHRAPEFFREAHQQYSVALGSLAQVWHRDRAFDPDTFSMAAMFMSFFEILASYDSVSRKSWTTHLSGIGSIYDTTDPQYLCSEFGARMYRMTRSQVIIHALQSKRSVPETFARSMQSLELPISPHFKPFDDCDMLLVRLANLQAQQSVLGNSSALKSEAIALNAACCQWMDDVPFAPWSFAQRPNLYQSGLWWDQREDLYSAGFIAHTWNKVR